MNKLKHILILIFLISLSCNKVGQHVYIEDRYKHLSDHEAGKWIGLFNDYFLPLNDIKIQILKGLEQEGTLIKKYQERDNECDVYTKIWDFKGLIIKEQYYQHGRFWNGPKMFNHMSYNDGEIPVWITYVLEKGVPFSEILKDSDQKIDPNRKYRHAATINCVKDHARLFLFGNSIECEEISLY